MSCFRIILLLTMSAAVTACLESNPQPSPAGDDTGSWTGTDTSGPQKKSWEVDSDRILVSAMGEDGATVVVGESGAAPGAEEMFYEADDSGRDNGDGEPAAGAVDEDGSFAVVVVLPEPVIKLHFVFPDGEEVVVELVPPETAHTDDADGVWVWNGGREGEEPSGTPPEEPYSGFADLAGQEITITIVVTGAESIEVTGTVFSTTPLAKVVAVNLSNLDKAVDSASNTGEFSLALSGKKGDVITVFAINPSDNSKATAPVNLVVP